MLTFHSSTCRVVRGGTQTPIFEFRCLLAPPQPRILGLGLCQLPPNSLRHPPPPQFSLFPVGLASLVYWKELKAPFVVCVNLSKLPHLCEPQFVFLQNGVEIKAF